jgi:nucleotide-binding universal stress UspA family protein
VTSLDQQQATIVVGYDGRESADHALDEAIRDAQESGARVVAVVVGNLPIAADPYGVGGGMGFEPMAAISEGGPAELQPILVAARERLAAAGVTGEAVWGIGDPASEIVRVAEETNAERIVVGHHHHSALGKFFGADTDARIKAAAGCDVVVTQ